MSISDLQTKSLRDVPILAQSAHSGESLSPSDLSDSKGARIAADQNKGSVTLHVSSQDGCNAAKF